MQKCKKLEVCGSQEKATKTGAGDCVSTVHNDSREIVLCTVDAVLEVAIPKREGGVTEKFMDL